ncbi:immunoglobulin-like domain-containing protein [Candidatus Bathycorpusculum sp.]|uniref:immunoglobulin-like domain-containing protein n=1 Tax=Candidatus Bathycorpusculum sp. TaxID=2994959 RepID=UPI00281915A4|nr:hypothetical protein [Candidatus Termitimicrobium sp.]MCL2686680.1 hypothetical protein [Candidatus Termitimicrobium sp.]
MNAKVVAVIILFCIAVAGCVVCISLMGRSNEPNSDTEPTSASKAVILEVKENSVSNTGLTLTIKNMGMTEYLYGSPYVIEQQVDGEWRQPPYIIENIAWTMIGYILEGNSTQEKEVDWTVVYGELSPGNYRITKDFSYMQSSGDYVDYIASVDFTVDWPLRGYGP